MNKKILVYENFFDDLLMKECISYSNSIENNFEDENIFKKNIFYWEKNIVEDSNIIFINLLNNQSTLYNTIYKLLKDNFDIKITGVNFYYWTQGSHIPWHNDTGYKGAITIYLNDNWNINHGGLFLFKSDNDNINALVPKKNMAVIQLGGVPHSVSATTKNSIIRKTIQMFF